MKVKIILKWFIGVIFILAAFGGIIGGIKENLVPILIFIFLGIFILPFTHYWIINKTLRLEISSKMKWLISIILLITAAAFIPDSEVNIEKNGDSELASEREEEIDQVNYFLKNYFKTVKDEDGIAYELKYEEKEINRTPIYESEKIYLERYVGPVYRNEEIHGNDTINYKKNEEGVYVKNAEYGVYVIVGSYNVTYEFKLFSNGNFVNSVSIDGLSFEVSQFRKGIDESIYSKITLGWCYYSDQYFPELKNKDKKDVVYKFTGGEFNCGYGEKINNMVYNAAIIAVKKSGILSE